MGAPTALRASTIDSIEAVGASEWDRLAAGDPLVGHGWLRALEESGAAAEPTDWRPCHLLLRDGATLVGAAPLWTRVGSEGEFVWQNPIEEACLAYGRRYAPRGVSVVPWTPVPGRRLLTDPSRDRAGLLSALASALRELASARAWASLAVHYCAADESEALQAVGFFERLTWQYRWRNQGYGSIDDYLARLTRKRRQSMRREMREPAAQGVSLEVRPGGRDDFATMARLYTATWRRHEGDEPTPLPATFFEALGRQDRDDVRFVVARRGGEVVGITLNVLSGEGLSGRFWGCEEVIPYLHFNVAYHRAIEHCIDQGLAWFDPGAGGDYKRSRGFDPVLVPSLQWHEDPGFHQALAEWAARERRMVLRHVDDLLARSPVR